jgi:hypothetical protein
MREDLSREGMYNLLVRKHPQPYPTEELFNSLQEDGVIPQEVSTRLKSNRPIVLEKVYTLSGGDAF